MSISNHLKRTSKTAGLKAECDALFKALSEEKKKVAKAQEAVKQIRAASDAVMAAVVEIVNDGGKIVIPYTPKGYRIWADELRPYLAEICGKAPAR